jgi:hypothetical protein
MATRDVYLKVDTIPGYSPDDQVSPPIQYRQREGGAGTRPTQRGSAVGSGRRVRRGRGAVSQSADAAVAGGGPADAKLAIITRSRAYARSDLAELYYPSETLPAAPPQPPRALTVNDNPAQDTSSGPLRTASTQTRDESVTDTLFADVSEFQPVVDDSYPYPVLSIRVSDGTYRDHNFADNYAWMHNALNSGRLLFGIVYTYVRPNWQDNASTVRSMIDANGGLHPRVTLMLDVEQGGNPSGDGSDWINRLYWNLGDYTGSRARIIGYGNTNDLNGMWQTKPYGVRIIVAAYGANPDYPGKVAHQYTDGSGFGGGLPQGAPPFGNCDMNSADGLDPNQFAVACGIPTPPPGGITMADATSLQADMSGVDINGAPEPWRLVLARHPRNIGDIVDDPARGPWNATHNGQLYQGSYDAFEQQVTVAEQLAWVHTFSDGITRDSGDVLIELMEFAIQWRKANRLPTTAK